MVSEQCGRVVVTLQEALQADIVADSWRLGVEGAHGGGITGQVEAASELIVVADLSQIRLIQTLRVCSRKNIEPISARHAGEVGIRGQAASVDEIVNERQRQL